MIEPEIYSLVTGAGQGLGRAFARELAAMGRNVILVSLKEEGLQEYCSELSKTYGIKAACYEADLTQLDEIENLTNWVEENHNIDVLINNAGLGSSGQFLQTDLNIADAMILLNVRATTLLTHKLAKLLIRNKNSFLLNVASMASFYPMPYKTVYSATKVYIEYFSKGLRQEYRENGLHISSLHPGPMRTSKHIKKRIEAQHWFSLLGLENSEKVAKKALERLFRKQNIILVGWGNKFHRILLKSLPSGIKMYLLSRGVKRELSR